MRKCDPSEVPFYLNTYAVLMTRMLIMILIIYMCLSFVLQVREDLNLKMQSENDQLLAEINRCTQDYYENRCEPENRVRALESFCQEK